MASGQGELGPTYWDVEEAFKALRARWRGTFWLEVHPPAPKQGTGPAWYVMACYLREGAGVGEAPRACGWYFKGNNGAKTLPAASWHAADLLREALEVAADVREAQSRF